MFLSLIESYFSLRALCAFCYFFEMDPKFFGTKIEEPIVKCSGDDCYIRRSCYRYTKKNDPYFQPFFFESPVEPAGKDCKYFLSKLEFIRV